MGSIESLVDLMEEVLAFLSWYKSEEHGAHPSFIKDPVNDGVISRSLLEALCFGWFLWLLPDGKVVEDELAPIDVSYDEDSGPNPLCLSRCRGCLEYLVEDVCRRWLVELAILSSSSAASFLPYRMAWTMMPKKCFTMA